MRNQTYFSHGDHINTFYNKRVSEDDQVRDRLSVNLFTSNFTKERLSLGEKNQLVLEQEALLENARERGLDPTDMLVELKCNSAYQGFVSDLDRLKEDIRVSSSQPRNQAIFIPEAAEKQLELLFGHGVKVKTFLETAYKVYVKNENRSNLGYYLKNLMNEQKELTTRLKKSVLLKQLRVPEQSYAVLTRNFSSHSKNYLGPEVPLFVKEVQNEIEAGTKKSLDTQSEELQLDWHLNPRTAYRLTKNYKTSFTQLTEKGKLALESVPPPRPFKESDYYI